MKLITFRREPGALPEPGVRLAGVAVSLTPLGYQDMPAVLAANDAGQASIRKFLNAPPPGYAVRGWMRSRCWRRFRGLPSSFASA